MDLIPRKLFLDEFFNDFTPSYENNLKCDIYEEDDEYKIELDVPGFKKENINIESDKGYIKITAEKKFEDKDESKDKKYIRRERSYGKYERSFYLGDINEEKIEAKFEHGVLKIKVPKKEQIETKKIIDIK